MRGAPGWVARLTVAADAFLFARPLPSVPDGQSVIAGYPWFGDWGRDTMISLPGLTLATGRPDVARRILKTFASFVGEGMLPNVFPGAGDHPAVQHGRCLAMVLRGVARLCRGNRRYRRLARSFPGLVRHDRMASEGNALRHRGRSGGWPAPRRRAGVQLTWMDAKVGDWVVTPRIGKPVEINALWYNALSIMSAFAARLGEPDRFTPSPSLQGAASRASCAPTARACTM